MPAADPTPVYERFLRAAELLGMSPQELAARLSASTPEVRDADSGAPDYSDDVRLHARYLGTRVEAVYEPSTGHVRIISGALADRTFPSPSRAAIAVVESVNPDRESANTNGRLFWIVTATGQPLRSLLGRR